MQVPQTNKPAGIIWVQFDHADVGEKTTHENRQLYQQNIDPAWTPIKPITTQFVVGRNKTVQVVKKTVSTATCRSKNYSQITR